jgi:16S rRNA (guanine1207-N2)-methyltransferase
MVKTGSEVGSMHVSIPSHNGIQEFELESSGKLFSPGKTDEGTLAMLAEVHLEQGQTLLDLGCGSGVVAIWAAGQLGAGNVSMLDSDPLAVEIAKRNAKANGFEDIRAFRSDGFADYPLKELDWILSNPPYHSDFSVAKSFIEKGFNRLKQGGRMVMVTKRETWYKNRFIAIFGGVKVARSGDYFVFTAQKRTDRYANAKAKTK